MKSGPEGALVYRKPSRRRVDSRRDRGDRRSLALPHGPGVRRGDGVVGHALCACPTPQRSGARACRRRTRYPRPRAGGGLRLSRSIHPRVPRPFRGHARSGPRLDAPRQPQTSGADRRWTQPQSTTFRRRVSRPASRCSSPASASVSLPRMAAPAFPASGSGFTSRCRIFPTGSGRSPTASAATATIPEISTTSPASKCPTSPICRANSAAFGFPKQKYAVFTHRDHISTIRRTVNTIWNHWLPASGLKAADAPNFERYDENFDPLTGDGGLEIWMPVKE